MKLFVYLMGYQSKLLEFLISRMLEEAFIAFHIFYRILEEAVGAFYKFKRIPEKAFRDFGFVRC